ncbi:tripartite tricarboxylate transporter substrate binding protein [Vannielia litorea]|uniref:Bug family tripartite tricarboxylate transporter substrate binding protein n=1 Tax=Vannielia TaxID=2813041 RepID=UPI001C947EB4|nr:tripartite tricarboxylate transporter substrate binding protein [Vannielia litorea]MBY6046308.1 tripartite tricarboxylate transporter substrate binding protein [Vannielia litorea]MBY6073721.1 tripartite tricarboxylate transporter substrate binding protein [Vannielia litorea]MBY6153803.1 tripartite tricarboxylate transporter substrate binding protein [Vannielia litorea]
MRKLLSTAAIALAIGASAPAVAVAQGYDAASEVTVLMGFKAGGGSDALAQLVQPFLAEELGVSFVNQYMPGATGAIAWTRLAKQVKPDGETISITNTPMLMTNYIMNDTITYNISELTPLANIVTDPGIAVVAADSPYQTFADLMEAAEANPGAVTVGNSGIGGDDFFTTVAFERTAGVKFQKVPFQGDGPSWTAAMGGQIDASFNNVGITFPQVEAGNLRALVVFAEERLAELPDVPTAKELGYDVVAGSSRGYSAPAGFPEEARTQLVEGLRRVTENPEFQAAAAAQAMNIDFIGGDDYTAFLQAQEKTFTEVWNEVKDDVQSN